MKDKEHKLRMKLLGAGVGLAFALTLIFGGALTAFLVVSFVTGGWLVGKYAAGEIDLRDLYDRYLRERVEG